MVVKIRHLEKPNVKASEEITISVLFIYLVHRTFLSFISRVKGSTASRPCSLAETFSFLFKADFPNNWIVLKLGEKNWVYATCSQGFTRRYSADRHIRNIHSGQANKVRLIDYLVGRLTGEFCRADPMKYRNAKPRDLNVISYEHGNLPAIPVRSKVPLSLGDTKTIVKADEEFRRSNFATYRSVGGSKLCDQADELNHEMGKSDTYGFLMASPRLEEVENLLMSFSAQGAKRPPLVEKTLFDLSSQIIKRGGDDTFLEKALKEARYKVNIMSMVEVLGRLSNEAGTASHNRSEPYIKDQWPEPSIANLPPGAAEDLAQIKDLLTPIYPPLFVQNKVKDLMMRYHQTGDPSIFKRALTYYLNNPSV